MDPERAVDLRHTQNRFGGHRHHRRGGSSRVAGAWSENYGPLPTDIRHVLNVSGFVGLPLQFNVSFNFSAYSRAPFSAFVGGIDFNGDGTANDLLPGTRVNQFNRGLDRIDLERLVADYNAQYAGRVTTGGRVAPTLALPDSFRLNDNFSALDLRVAREIRTGPVRLSLFVDVFNMLNTRNLTGFNGNLASPATFGQATGRIGSAFGSGGPASGQFGVRVDF